MSTYSFDYYIGRRDGKDYTLESGSFETLGELLNIVKNSGVKKPYQLGIQPMVRLYNGKKIKAKDFDNSEPVNVFIFDKLIYPNDVIADLRLRPNGNELVSRFLQQKYAPNTPLFYTGFRENAKQVLCIPLNYSDKKENAVALNTDLKELYSHGRLQDTTKQEQISPLIQRLFELKKQFEHGGK